MQTCRKEITWSNTKQIPKFAWVFRVLFHRFADSHAALLVPAVSGKAVSILLVKCYFDILLGFSEREPLFKLQSSLGTRNLITDIIQTHLALWQVGIKESLSFLGMLPPHWIQGCWNAFHLTEYLCGYNMKLWHQPIHWNMLGRWLKHV